MNNLNPFFEPRSIVVVGASRSPGKAGNVILENIIANGFQGHAYAVNPNVQDILGIPCYPSVSALPEAPDLAIVAVPAVSALDTMRECAAKGVKAAVVTTSGFAEIDDGGHLQAALRELSRTSGLRVMGPNTSGITSTPQQLCASIFPLGAVKRGSVSVIAQTGNFATHTMKWLLSGENLGVCRVAGLGNMVDVDESEVLEYYGSDNQTKAIALYLEGFGNPRRLLAAAKEISRTKPIIALKSGRTEAGVKAVASHTASLASNDAIVDSLFRESGIVRVSSYAALLDCIKMLSFQPVPKSNRIAVLTPSGAMGIVAADSCERLGLRIGELSERSQAELGTIFPSYIRVGNPIDIWGATLAHGVFQSYEKGLRVALEDDGIDAVLCILLLAPTTVNGQEKLDLNCLEFLPRLCREFPTKPVMVAVSGSKDYFEPAKAYLEDRSVPVFLPVEPGLEALAYLNRCRSYVSAAPLSAPGGVA